MTAWWFLPVLATIAALAIYAFGRAIYRAPIDWEQDAANEPLRPIEEIARNSGL
jgi:hypothetical protein